MRKQIAVFIVILFSFTLSFGQTIPKYSGYVNDFAGVLSVEQKNSLEQEVRNFEKKTSTEIAVLVVKDLQGYEPVVFAQKTFSEWKIGKKGANNGVLLLVSIGNRKARIHTGYGLEGCLPDAMTDKIQRRNLVPAFKAGMYFEGIRLTVSAIMETVKNEKFDTVDDKKDETATSQKITGIVILIVFFFIVMVIFIPVFLTRRRENKEQDASYYSSRRDREESNYSPIFIASSISHDDSPSFSGGDSDGGSPDSGCDFGGGDSGGGGSDSSW